MIKRVINAVALVMITVGAINAGRSYKLLRDLSAVAIKPNSLDNGLIFAIERMPESINASIIAILVGMLILSVSDWIWNRKRGGKS